MKIEFITVEEVKAFLNKWEEHHTLSRGISDSFDRCINEMECS